MADSTLGAIRKKVRRLTRNPSPAQLTDSDIDEYVNTFLVYDFPEHLRTFNLRQEFTFTCNPFQDVYPTDILSFSGTLNNIFQPATNASQQPLYNFQNRYISVHDPLYIAGYQSFYTQSREQFYGIYPIVNQIQQISLSGDGVTTNFTGIINTQSPAIVPNGLNQLIGLMQNEVLFSSVDINGNGLAMVDVPALDSNTGNPTVWGSLVVNTNPLAAPILLVSPYVPVPGTIPVGLDPNNYINYATGAFSVTFPIAPASNAPINSQVVANNLALPQAILFYEDQFVLRPVPDQPYRINFEVFIRPTALLAAASVPQLEEWWQYVAYGAAKKVFEDRSQIEDVQLIIPEYKLQERLCLRRSLVQWSNERVATIYTEQTSMGSGFNGWGYGGGNF